MSVVNRRFVFIIALGLSVWIVQQLISQNRVGLVAADRIRVAEVFRLGQTLGDQIWTNWSKAPFGLMLVSEDYEYLIHHPRATNNFDTLGFDTLLNGRVLYRKRLFEKNLFATFPAINGISTIVVGQSENTNATSSTSWIVTVLHEHFHQLQQSQPDYFSSTLELGLSRGDQSGVWMLNYPFPYDSSEVDESFSAMAQSLMEAVTCSKKDEPKCLKIFFGTRERFKLLLSKDDFNYFSFQCWQEGVARYTELRVAEFAATQYSPSEEFKTLKDFKPFKGVADSIRSNIYRGLTHASLAKQRREAFYSFGAGEAMLLDKVHSDWKQSYFTNKFHLEKYYSR